MISTEDISLVNTNQSKVVEVELIFMKIGVIDTISENYQAEIRIISRWLEEDVNLLEYNEQKCWNPKLYIKNVLQILKEERRYELDYDDELNNTQITEIRSIKGIFWEKIEFRNFPFDIQQLSIELTSELTKTELKLDPNYISHVDFFALNTFIDQQKWKLFKIVDFSLTDDFDTIDSPDWTSSGPSLTQTDRTKFPRLLASCYCLRRPGYYVFNAFLLIFLITIGSLVVFAVDCKLPANRLQTTITLLLTSVTFKWITNRSLPTVYYLSSLDRYSIGCIVFLTMICAWHSIVGSFWPKDLAIQIDQWALIAFACLYFLFNMSFIAWWLKCLVFIRKFKNREKKFITMIKSSILDEMKNDYEISTKKKNIV